MVVVRSMITFEWIDGLIEACSSRHHGADAIDGLDHVGARLAEYRRGRCPCLPLMKPALRTSSTESVTDADVGKLHRRAVAPPHDERTDIRAL